MISLDLWRLEVEMTYFVILAVVSVSAFVFRGIAAAVLVLIAGSAIFVIWHGLYTVLALIGLMAATFWFFDQTEIGRRALERKKD